MYLITYNMYLYFNNFFTNLIHKSKICDTIYLYSFIGVTVCQKEKILKKY